MKNVVLAAGYATRMYPLTENYPKPLLPVGDSTILDKMLEDVDALDEIDEHIIVTNHRFIKIFEDWLVVASDRYAKPIRLLDDGSTSNDNRIGAVGDLVAAIREFDIKDDILVAAADNLLDFSLASLVDFFKEKGTAVIFYYDEMDEVRLHRCGVICMDENGRVTDMEEKPAEPKSHHVTPPFYIYSAKDIPLILSAIDNGCQWDAPGNLAGHISRVASLHALRMPGSRLDIGSLDGYRAISGKTLVAFFSPTGTTAAVAKDLAGVTCGTLYEIKPEVKYTAADLDWRVKTSRSSVEMKDKNSRPAIVADLEDADSYKTIFIGFPVWWYTAPTIINTFIETYGFAGKTVIFFATSGGSDVSGADKQFAAQYPDINWKPGKLLNSYDKKSLSVWAASCK